VSSHSIAIVTAAGSAHADRASRDAPGDTGGDGGDAASVDPVLDPVHDAELDPVLDPADAGPRGSWFDDGFTRIFSTPARLRWYRWGLPILVTLLAATLRLWNLGSPHVLVFDETFYVKDAWTLLHDGYEATWPNNYDPSFASGAVNGYLTAPEFVAHPPFGKWMIALGMALFGAQDSFGWRISTALVGILAVVVVMCIAKRMFASTLVAALAGFIMAVDGEAIVMSRVALLDNFVMFLALLAFWCVLLDRDWHRRRLAAWIAQRREAGGPVGTGASIGWGPWLWWRPWLLVAAVLLGLCSGTKWTGFYFLAFFAVYVMIGDALARRRAGIPFWPEAGLLRGGIVAFVLMVPLTFVVYVATWTGWILTKGGYYRDYVQTTPGTRETGFFSWVPDWVQNLWHYQQEMYEYSINLHVFHPYMSNPLTWLLQLRPTSMYYVGTAYGQHGCTSHDGCSAAITDLGNPLVWWLGTAAVLYLLYRLIRYRDWRHGAILVGLAAGYLPWMLYMGRTIFTFYSIAFAPYLYLALAAVAALVIGRRSDDRYRRTRGLNLIIVSVVVIGALSAFFYPIWTGMTTPYWFWQMHMWIPDFPALFGAGTWGWI
jgi:dolichyl-phosphate-mannose-protein mannosyltransferase